MFSFLIARAGRSEGQCGSAGTERLGSKTRGANYTPTTIIILSTVNQTTVTGGGYRSIKKQQRILSQRELPSADFVLNKGKERSTFNIRYQQLI